eukprot:gene7825-5458_t
MLDLFPLKMRRFSLSALLIKRLGSALPHLTVENPSVIKFYPAYVGGTERKKKEKRNNLNDIFFRGSCVVVVVFGFVFVFCLKALGWKKIIKDTPKVTTDEAYGREACSVQRGYTCITRTKGEEIQLEKHHSRYTQAVEYHELTSSFVSSKKKKTLSHSTELFQVRNTKAYETVV